MDFRKSPALGRHMYAGVAVVILAVVLRRK